MLLAKGAIMTSFVVVMLAPTYLRAETAIHAGAAAIVSSKGAAQLTGKERLGEKWKDEQRTDNCKVPAEKQGPKPRPDSCRDQP
jgi:hypothetical protein